MDQEIRYKILTVDLGKVRAKEEYKIPGYNMNVLSLDGSATLRLNHVTGDAIDLTLIDQIQSKFGRFYITNSAQSGKTLILAIGQHNFKIINDPMPVWQHQTDATLDQATPVKDTYYTILDTTPNVRIAFIAVEIRDTNETLQVRITLDGVAIESNAFVMTADIDGFIMLEENIDGFLLILGTTQRIGYRGYTLLEGKSVKVEVRKTTEAGTGNLKGCVSYSKKVKR